MDPTNKSGDPVAGLETAGRVSHPRGLWTLFLTEMWERFSYYGMRALLVLFMVDEIQTGGMGLDEPTAGALYGLYTAFVYLAALPGGWMADRLLGAQRAVFVGGIIIALGHFVLAIPSTRAFFMGLILVVIGTGLLKPNVSALVGQLYPEGGARRDAGFTMFYLGINLGAAIGPLICGALGEKVNWHYGFAAAGVGMVFGVAQFWVSRHWLGAAGLVPERRRGAVQGLDRAWLVVLAGALILVAVVAAGMTGVLPLNPLLLAQGTTYVIVGMAVLYFTGVFVFGSLNGQEKRHVTMIVILFAASAMFWSGFEQAGSSLNLFAERYTDRIMDWWKPGGGQVGYEIPASWFQSLNPIFIITLAPLFAAGWVRLAKRQLDPSIPVKFAWGLILLAVGFLVMAWAARLVLQPQSGGQVLPVWLIFTYLFHTMGEICLSPVGLSSVTKLAPARFVGQMMGTWFMATALGNLIAGLLAGGFREDAVDQMPALFMQVVWTSLGTGVLLLVFARPLRRLLVGVK